MQRNAEESKVSSSTVSQFSRQSFKILDLVAWRAPLLETIHLRLGLKSMWPRLQPGQNPLWDLKHDVLIRIIHLVPGLTEDQGVCVSAQKGFIKRQSFRKEIDLLI